MDHSHFLTVIHQRPWEDLPRLIYADWLEEQGNPRGEFIRVQCELQAGKCSRKRQRELQAREAELLTTHQTEWVPFLRRVTGKADLAFRRGLLWCVTITDPTDADLRALQGNAELEQVRFLSSLSRDDENQHLTPAEQRERCRHYHGSRLTTKGIAALLTLPRLAWLRWEEFGATDDWMPVLAKHPWLQVIYADENLGTTEGGFRTLFAAPRLCFIAQDGVRVEEIGYPHGHAVFQEWADHRMARWRERNREEQRREAILHLSCATSYWDLDKVQPRGTFLKLELSEMYTLDGDLEYSSVLDELESLQILNAKLEGAGLQHLARLPKLRSVHITGNPPAELEGLMGLTQLKSLRLQMEHAVGHLDSRYVLNDQSLRGLGTLRGLVELELSTDQTWPVEPGWVQLTDSSLATVAALSDLKKLRVDCVGSFTAAGLSQLRTLKRLTHLRIGSGCYAVSPTLDDAAAASLNELTQLRVLDLSGWKITNEGLRHLFPLKQLRWLNLSGVPSLLLSAVKDLLLHLPRLTVFGNWFNEDDEYQRGRYLRGSAWKPTCRLIKWDRYVTLKCPDFLRPGYAFRSREAPRGLYLTKLEEVLFPTVMGRPETGQSLVRFRRTAVRSAATLEATYPSLEPYPEGSRSGVPCVARIPELGDGRDIRFVWRFRELDYTLECQEGDEPGYDLFPVFLRMAQSIQFQQPAG